MKIATLGRVFCGFWKGANVAFCFADHGAFARESEANRYDYQGE
jgi:hypothetical protein